MKNKLITSITALLILTACSNNAESEKSETEITSENDVDAARNFINATLKGQMDDARRMLVSDSLNNQYFDAYERVYRTRMDPEDRRGYREATINIHEVKPLNDSTTIILYSNSFKKKHDSLKVVMQNNQWLVDLKYSFPSTTADTTKP